LDIRRNELNKHTKESPAANYIQCGTKKTGIFIVTFNRAYLHQLEINLNIVKCKMIVR